MKIAQSSYINDLLYSVCHTYIYYVVFVYNVQLCTGEAYT